MQERVQAVLDGELGRDGLSGLERAELGRYEEMLGAARGLYGRALAPDLSADVQARIAALSPVPAWVPGALTSAWLGLARAAAWLWSPRPLALRPAYGLAALVVLLGAGLLLGGGNDVGSATAPQRLLVQFRLGAEGAQQVALTGDFTEWQGTHSLEEVSPGVWSVVLPLEPGIYDYAFVVDGEQWILDPLAPAVADGFGGSNSRVAVMAPERSSPL